MNAVEVNGYTKIIKKRTVLDNITLTIPLGKIYGFVGANGSGKSMLFRAIAGMINPTQGTVNVLGESVSMRRPARDTGLIIEHVGFWPQYTGYQCLMALAMIRKKIGNDEIHAVLRRVGLNAEDKRTYSKYSLGMKQRLAIAQAIMESPKLLILDEPANALDSQGIELLHTILQEERSKGTTILLASHIKQEIETYCDHICTLENGGIIEAHHES